MDGEPLLKRPKVKIRAPSNACLHLSLQEWYNLIFSRLSLVELIQLKRTCKSFATYKKLKELITLKQNSAFHGFQQRHWNRISVSTKGLPLDEDANLSFENRLINIDFFEKHKGQYIFIRYYPCLTIKEGKFMIGVFSSKALLLNAFHENVEVANTWGNGIKGLGERETYYETEVDYLEFLKQPFHAPHYLMVTRISKELDEIGA